MAATSDEVMLQLDRLLKPFGSVGAYERDQQISHQYLSDELRQLKGMAFMAPPIFLSVAAFLLNIVISRMISQQREQIAALKGLWLHELRSRHSLSALGAGHFAERNGGGHVVRILDGGQYHRDVSAVLQISGARIPGRWDGLRWHSVDDGGRRLGNLVVGARDAIRLPPAEAMRPEPPASYQPTWIERVLPTGSTGSRVADGRAQHRPQTIQSRLVGSRDLHGGVRDDSRQFFARFDQLHDGFPVPQSPTTGLDGDLCRTGDRVGHVRNADI